METPQLILPIADKSGRIHNILLSTERERTHWRSALEQVLDKLPHNTDKFYSLRRTTPDKISTDYFHSPSRSRSSSIGDFSERLKKYKHVSSLVM